MSKRDSLPWLFVFVPGLSAGLSATSAPNVEGWLQVGEIALALVLSALIGLEREIRQKAAGLRTHSLVGIGAALFMLVSKYGFNDVLQTGRVELDPSRVAAQIVTGIGFIGAGLIFVRGDSVRGLTTAAAIWITAAVGAAAGAGLPILAVLTTGFYFVVTLIFLPIARKLPRSATAISMIRVRYPDGKGLLREILQVATDRGFAVDDVSTVSAGYRRPSPGREDENDGDAMVDLTMHLHGRGSVHELAATLSEMAGVDAVAADDTNVPSE